MDEIERSRKSKMKKRPEDWDQMKTELAQELGLWPKVQQDGWSGLSAVDSGRLGGVLAARKKSAATENTADAEQVVKAENFPPPADN